MTIKRTLCGKAINPVAMGCMNVFTVYGPALPWDEAGRVFERALDLGYDHFDTARLYGLGRSEELIGERLSHRRHEFTVASKMGIFNGDGKRWIDCRPETIRAECEISLRALKTDHIDLYYMHRRDFSTPIEDSVGAMADLVAEGKIGGIGLSEMSAETLRRAHAVHPIAAMQSEYSPFSRNVEIALLDATRELDVALVAFSPVGRGALGGVLRDLADLPEGDLRTALPRFQGENWTRNLALVDAFDGLAADCGVTPAQLAIGWVLSRGDHVIALPGTRSLDHLAENIARADWRPPAEVVARIDALFRPDSVAGPRYNAALQATIDTEEFA
ncbi:aldo/keto reductase [Novosphingobium flavum]|uniref:aldo/keto reductase n=1 Tax=Novosphingobium aerophilum TaxID=2839843 RepID=UPI0016396E83|nr:aldo/keto reductase [Novosphingobium aerophilum]MBC2663643.1 aldo/keto reductase [Novosphingobium aerophilum]